MIRPSIQPFKHPDSIRDYPVGPSWKAGHLVSKNSDYRTFRPILTEDACIGCLLCYVSCPDGVICRNNGKTSFDYDFCKGCGICSNECKSKAINMERES